MSYLASHTPGRRTGDESGGAGHDRPRCTDLSGHRESEREEEWGREGEAETERGRMGERATEREKKRSRGRGK